MNNTINTNTLKEQLIEFFKMLNEEYVFIELIGIQDLILKTEPTIIFELFNDFFQQSFENKTGKQIIENLLSNISDDIITKKCFSIIFNYVCEKNKKIKQEKLIYIIDQIWYVNSDENKKTLAEWIQNLQKIVLLIQKKKI